MEFTKDDLRAAYIEGYHDGWEGCECNFDFSEEDFETWFDFVFKDRLDEEQAYIDTQAEIWKQKLNPSKILWDEGPGNR